MVLCSMSQAVVVSLLCQLVSSAARGRGGVAGGLSFANVALPTCAVPSLQPEGVPSGTGCQTLLQRAALPSKHQWGHAVDLCNCLINCRSIRVLGLLQSLSLAPAVWPAHNVLRRFTDCQQRYALGKTVGRGCSQVRVELAHSRQLVHELLILKPGDRGASC